MESILNKYFKIFEEGYVSLNSDSSINVYNKYKEQIDETFQKANKISTDIMDIIDKTKENLWMIILFLI